MSYTTTAQDYRPKYAFDINLAVKTIGDLAKQHNVSLAELTAAFPKRPTNEMECEAIASWMGVRIREMGAEAKSSPTPAPQAKLPANVDKNGKARPTYYAIEFEGKMRFFRVKVGRKSGFYFVDEQASDEFYPVRQNARRSGILYAIMKDPEAAMRLYGQEIGRCCLCHHTLTSEYRKLGIGPVCINK